MNRCLAILFLLGCLSANFSHGAESPPNILFILCDDLGWGDFGVLHQNHSTHPRRHQTPMIDQMAAEGMQMRSHYCPAPVCAPSRASLLTGVHQGHAEIRDNQFDKMLEDNHTLATVLRQAGYRTAMVGKYGLPGKGDSAQTWPGYPTRRGFDEYFGYVRHVDGHVHYPADVWPLGNNERHRSPKEVWHNEREVSAGLSKCYTTDLFTARSKDWIIQHTDTDPQQPFFLYLAYDTPHAALQLPAVEFPQGRGVDGGLQWLGREGQMINTARGEIDSYRHPDYVGKGWRDVEVRFATMVRRIDNCVGDLLQTLRDLGIAQNTLVVISSDNGPLDVSYIPDEPFPASSFQSYGPFDGIKRDAWEGGIRMATVAWWPDHIAPGSIDQRPSQFHDWMPTFADLAGVVPPARTDGVSLRPTLLGEGDPPQSTIYVEYMNRTKTPSYDDFAPSRRGRRRGQMQVLHLDGYKGVRVNVASHDDPFEIYDLRIDPQERNDLRGSSEFFETLHQRMKDQVLRGRLPNESAKRPYDDVAIPAVQVAENMAGVRWRTFQGPFPYVPKLTDQQPEATGVSPSLESIELPPISSASENGAAELTGWIRVPAEGKYRFELSSGRPAFFRVHDIAAIDADYGYDSGVTRSVTLNLGKGYHPFRLTCLRGDDPLKLGLRCGLGDQLPSELNASWLFCR